MYVAVVGACWPADLDNGEGDMHQNGTFRGTIKIRQSLGDETVIKDAQGYAWHGEHGVLEVVQDHGNRIRFFPINNIREVTIIPSNSLRPRRGRPPKVKRVD